MTEREEHAQPMMVSNISKTMPKINNTELVYQIGELSTCYKDEDVQYVVESIFITPPWVLANKSLQLNSQLSLSTRFGQTSAGKHEAGLPEPSLSAL